MGCGSGKAVTDARDGQNGVNPKAIIVWGAKGLRKGDCTGSDPYVIVRVGEAKTKWAEKTRGTGRRSQTAKEAENPQWNFGFAFDIHGFKVPEIHVRVYDLDFVRDDDFLGEAVFSFEALLKSNGTPAEAPLGGDAKAKGTVSVSAGPVSMLQKIDAPVAFEGMSPIGEHKPWDITSDAPFPLIVGTAPLPPTLRGVFWLTDQKGGSALVSLGGPNGDGGGCSLGRLSGKNLSIRVLGDRVWSYAAKTGGQYFVAPDLIYNFTFDNAETPTKCQIYPEARNLGFVLKQEWLLDFEMVLKEEGDAEYPGSVVWRRPTYLAGSMVYEYALCQVMDENGNKIQPAWDKFVAYQKSPVAGDTPGVIWYREIAAK